jgi:AcrR family transcriptional regulator
MTFVEGSEGRRERKSRETRERIFREAVALFVIYGFDATKVRDIAEKAGVSTVTVHNHFRTKERLLYALAELYFERVIALLETMVELAATGAGPAEFEKTARSIVLEWPTTGRQLSADTQRAVIRTVTGNRLHHEMRSVLVQLMTNLQVSGLVRRDVAPGALAAGVGDLVLGALTSWSTDLSDDQSPSEKVGELVTFLVATLQPSPRG